jgi:serine/threonine protein kinase/tetratricopeptide (TPR) repeat protein
MREDDLSDVPTDPRAPVVRALVDLAPGRVLAARYEIRAHLGSGGMGSVYRARDQELGDEIALKVLLPDRLGDRSNEERFRREVKIARRITHPNVCRVFDLGEDGGVRFLTMELIEGKTLRALLAANELGPERALAILEQLVAGLSAVHAQGVIHRDLKPENVIVRHGGQAVVADFGLSRGPLLGQTSASIVAGTPAYMSPEQLRGEPLDVRSDLFSLGIVGFELLAGRSPFGDGAPATIATAIMRDPPFALDVPGLSAEEVRALSRVLLRSLAKRPEDRFASAVEFGAALARVQAISGGHLGSQRETTTTLDSMETLQSTHKLSARARSVRRLRRERLTYLGALSLASVIALGLGLRLSRYSSQVPIAPVEAATDAGALDAAVETAETADAERPTISVALFENLSGDPSVDGTAQGASEAVRAGLRTLPEVRVLEGTPIQPEATWLFAGSVQRVGGQLRLAGQLRAMHGGIAGEPIEIDGSLDQPTRLLSPLREAAIDEVRLMWRSHHRRLLAVKGTQSEEARSRLLRYYEMIGPAPRPEHYEAGKRLLDKAVEVDPAYVLARVERSYLEALGVGASSRGEGFAAAQADLDRALAAEPRSPEALAMRCRVLRVSAESSGHPTDAGLDAALDACGAAIQADPSSVQVRMAFARLYDRLCHDDQAMDSLQKALALDRSASGAILLHLLGLSLENGRMHLADRVSQQLVEFQEKELRRGARSLGQRAGAHEVRGAHVLRAAVLMRLGRSGEARAEIERELEDVSSGTADRWAEAAAIRGLLRLARQDGAKVATGLDQRLRDLEHQYAVEFAKDRSVAWAVASAYRWIDPPAAVEWLGRLGPVDSLETAVRRAPFYHAAGRDEDARRMLGAMEPRERWEKACKTSREVQLSQGPR